MNFDGPVLTLPESTSSILNLQSHKFAMAQGQHNNSSLYHGPYSSIWKERNNEYEVGLLIGFKQLVQHEYKRP